VLAGVSYWLVEGYSQIGATLLAGFVLYSVVILCANYKVSRYYSLYLHNNQLAINNSMWGLIVIPIAQISNVEIGNWPKIDHSEDLKFGRGKYCNVRLSLAPSSSYYSNMGQTKEIAHQVYLSIERPEIFQSMLAINSEEKGE
jgi:hypothetical protein